MSSQAVPKGIKLALQPGIIAARIPQPTPFVPDTKTFLTLIGRDLLKHESKIPSWDALFSLSSRELRESGFEPARARRYLLWWRERFRQGTYGIGGDLENVTNGVAELRVAKISQTMKTVVINPPLSDSVLATTANSPVEGETAEVSTLSSNKPPPEALEVSEESVHEFAGVRIVGEGRHRRVACAGIDYVKGDPAAALLRVKEGLWEQKRGVKVDGGERRRKEVRTKRRAAERRAAR